MKGQMQIMPFMYCDPPAAIVQIRPAVDQTHAGAGMIKLKSGATFQISTPASNDGDFLKRLKKTDHIQLCYAPSQRWADAVRLRAWRSWATSKAKRIFMRYRIRAGDRALPQFLDKPDIPKVVVRLLINALFVAFPLFVAQDELLNLPG